MTLNFSQQILHGADRLQTVQLPPRRWPPLHPGIVIRSLNVWNDRGFGLAQDIRAVECGGSDRMILTEIKTQTEAYYHNRLGYDLTCLAELPSSARRAQGGLCLVIREWTNGWGIKSTRFHGPNVVSCEIVTGNTQIPLVGVHLPPLTLDHLPDFKESLHLFKVLESIVIGDFNVDLDNT